MEIFYSKGNVADAWARWLVTPAAAAAGMTTFAVIQLNFSDGDGAATCHYFDRQVTFVVLTNFRLHQLWLNLLRLRRRRRRRR